MAEEGAVRCVKEVMAERVNYSILIIIIGGGWTVIAAASSSIVVDLAEEVGGSHAHADGGVGVGEGALEGGEGRSLERRHGECGES